MNMSLFLRAAFKKQTGHTEASQVWAEEAREAHPWLQTALLSAEMLITVEHAPIDVINQVNETQCQ